MAEQSRFSPGLSQVELAAGYKKAGEAPAFTKSDLTKAYQPYAPFGIKVNKLHKNKTDTQLYQVASQAVILKYKADQKAKGAKPPPAVPSKTPSGARPAAAPKPAPKPASPAVLSGSRTAQLLRAAGFSGSKPPPYALTSEANLAAWIKRAQAYAVEQAAKKKAQAKAVATQSARATAIWRANAAKGVKTYSPGRPVPT